MILVGGQGRAEEAPRAEIGRVGAIVGAVQYQPPTGSWSDALVNEPVAAGTGLRTADGADAELRLPGATLAAAPASELRILHLDAEWAEIALPQGRIDIHLAARGAAQTVEVDLPRGGLWLQAPGDYEIAAGDAQTPPRIEVLGGKVALGGGLTEGEIAAAAPDLFRDWSQAQDAGAESDIPHLPAGTPGAAALDAAGRWENDATYGAVWYPSDVAADWAPFRDGVWRFLPPWGWTWIDNAAWGFAPSHYGRWVRLDDRWGWAPDGESVDYSPAVVAFLGTAGIGLSRPGDAGPAVAWFPLAPRETIGDGNDAGYRNRRFASAVPRAVFVAGKPVAAALVTDLPERRFADAPVILQSLDIPPGATTASAATPAVAAAAPVPAAGPSNGAARTPFVVVLREPPPRPAHIAARTPPHPARLAPRHLASLVVRHVPGSTAALRSAHNRQHLAAIRGGA
ncbi:MAG TPA: DUF6600 domain-containing protein [Stellaceae bacterium]|nr:DUF6600 domain-containing protein [Stellaceae bacterium]